VIRAAYAVSGPRPFGTTKRSGVPACPAVPASITSNGPTTNATRYAGSGFDSAKSTCFVPPGSSRSETTGAFASATSAFGAWSESFQGTLYDGSSKHGNARRASMGSKNV
jgi:hypothetical protein